MTASIKIEHTRKVARIAHIHSIGNGSYRRTWSINSGLQILIEDIVTVIGSNETLHRQSHTFTKQSGSDISKVTARNTDNGIIRFA